MALWIVQSILAAQTEMYPDIKAPVTDKLFLQNGRKVFPQSVQKFQRLSLNTCTKMTSQRLMLKMMWLHQANANMLDLILRTVIGKDADKAIAPSVIAEFANTSSASPMIVFHRHKDDLASGDFGVICSFRAGYSIGSVLVRKV